MVQATKDRVYKCLNPVGIHDPVEQFPLSPRLEKIDGKTILFSLGTGGEQEILIPLRKKLLADYPNVNWKMQPGGMLTEEQLKSCDAVMRGVVW
jgi:hypothetical protein